MSAIFVGYKTTISPDSNGLIAEPKAPKNYKDEAKISAYIEEARAEIRGTASSKPFTGIFEEACICLYDSDDNTFECHEVYVGSTAFPKFLKDLETAVWKGMQAFMFQSSSFMRLISMQALREKLNSKLVNHWLLNHPKARGLIVDLPRIFLPSQEEVSRIGYVNMFSHFGVSLSQADMENTQTQARKLYDLYCACNKFDGLVFNEVRDGQ